MKNKIKTHWNEYWVMVPSDYETKTCDYFFSNYGRLKSVDKATGIERLLQGSKSKYGFLQLNLRFKDNKRQGFYVHRLIASEFVPNMDPENKKFLIHIDCNKKNNFYKNLKWVNQEELTEHQKAQGRFDPRYKNGRLKYKMTETRVALLKKRLLEKKTKRKILARNFGISEMQVKRIERGENWGYVKPAE